MTAPRRKFRLGLQAKVLIPVVGFLVLFPAVTLWVVDRHMTRHMEDEALLTVNTAESVFLKSLENLNASYLAWVQSLAGEARFKVMAGEIRDPRTLEDMLEKQLKDLPATHEILLLVNEHGERIAGQRRSTEVDLDHFSTAGADILRKALQGKGAIGSVGFDGRAYSAIAVPVTTRTGSLAGALVVAVRIPAETVVGLKLQLKLQRTEVFLSTGNTVVVSTVPRGGELPPISTSPQQNGAERVLFAGEHFMARSGVIDAANTSASGVRYLILSSYEERLRASQETRQTLLLISVVGVAGSIGVVGWLVRRVMRPLRELNESAEAVGGGDFSRRVQRVSDDECGDLAEAFNRMTVSLQSSRAELETAMQQVRTAREQLIQSEKLSAVGQFVAGIAHELNNPLTAVVGFSELLQSSSTDDKTRSHLDRIAKSAHRCHKIVHSLLSFARQHAPERKLVGIQTVVEEALDIMTYDLRTSNVTVVRDFAPGLPQIMADRHQLQQVFVNILSNARQAIEPVQRDGRIVIRAVLREDKLVLEFQDNGPGIKPEHLVRIFDPFFTTKPIGKGTGLGLSLCYGIIQEHRGMISVRSEPGQGATFSIELPVAADAKAPAAVVAGTRSPFAVGSRAPNSGMSVLVIDDEQWILELARELASAEGHTVETAMGGQQALELLSRGRFDVIVSDWKMPGLNGVRLYEHLRANDPAIARRVVFMTGDVVSDTFQEFLRTNSLTCLSKPFARGEFRAAIAKLASGATARM